MRNEIDLAAETIIMSIQNSRDELLKKIDQYERQCEEKCAKENFERVINQYLIYQTKDYLNKWYLTIDMNLFIHLGVNINALLDI